MKLLQYLKGRRDIDLSPVVELLAGSKDRLRPGALADDLVRQLVDSARSIDDAVATAHLVRSYANRQNRALFTATADVLDRVPASIDAAGGGPVRRVSILSSVADGHHIKLVYSHAAALLTQAQVQHVRLVLTGEWTWHLWQRANAETFVATLQQDFRQQLEHYPDIGDVLARLDERFSVSLAPRPQEIGPLLGDVVLRFEGPAAFKTTTLYGRAIHAARPVVTGTFSSHVVAGRGTDLTLTRAVSDRPGAVHFVPPAAVVLPITPPAAAGAASQLLVTVYSQERIRAALKAMPAEGWAQLARLFDALPQLEWSLIGAADPAAARAELPEDFERRYGSRITVHAYSDLREIYPRAFAFLALPQVFGGAGGATMAICYGLPVVVAEDRNSDISNTLPDELQHRGLADMVDRLLAWAAEPSARLDFIGRQQAFLADRMDLRKKGRELLARLQEAVDRRAAAPAGTGAGSNAGTTPAPVAMPAIAVTGGRKPAAQAAAQEGEARTRTKVFCVGRNKTGTTSIAQALHRLGYKMGGQQGAARTLPDWRQRDFRSIVEFCRTADAFQDMPFSLDFTFQALDMAFPGAKFVLTVRDSAEQWYNSITKFHSKVVGAAGVPPTVEELRRYKNGWLLNSQSMIYGVGEDRIYDREIYMAHYESHNARVIDYFKYRPKDLLVLNVGDDDAMRKLCEFLDIPYRGQKFPHANSTSTTQARI